MKTRQAVLIAGSITVLTGLWGCSPSTPPEPTPTTIPSTPTITATATLVPATPTATPPGCLTQPGELKKDSLTKFNPPQEFLIYLPPCYSESDSNGYPVLYLLHGQTYTDDQWIRLGAATHADRLIHSGEAPPFILVFPDDHYWNLAPGPGFGKRLINDVIPYVDANYRTLADREHRAIGGLSRGGGWAIQLGFKNYELFGMIGLHSPAIFKDDSPYLETWLRAIPPESRPRLWFDIGDNDKELGSGRVLEEMLTRYSYLHEFHMYSGDHSEAYWSLHVEEYLRWYAEAWKDAATVIP
jgi:enterochelin esterase-like enzyme